MKAHGYTLLEVVVVTGLIIMTLSLGGITVGNAQRSQRLQEVTRSIVNDLESARANALRYSGTSTFTVNTNQKSYSFIRAGSTVNRTLPYGSTVGFCQNSTCTTTTTSSITYSSPNAEVPPGNHALRVNLQGKTLYIKIIGVTGKVVSSANL